MESKPIKTLSQFLSTIESNTHSPRFSVFRGHGNIEWDLMPGIGRGVYGTIRGYKKVLAKLVREFRFDSRIFTNEYLEKSNVEILYLAQHFGIPTNLLDWTINPLIALLFSLESPSTDGCVWIYSGRGYYYLNKKSTLSRIKRPIIVKPERVDRRLASQESYFTYFPIPRSNGKFHSLTKYIRVIDSIEKLRRRPRECLIKVPIDKAHKESLKHQLLRYGMDELFVYPDMRGLAESLKVYLEYQAKR